MPIRNKETIDHFLEDASVGQACCVCDLIEHEQGVRERNKKKRLFRKAAFPQIKSFEGYGRDELKELEFIDSAQNFVFFGQTGLGKTHLAIAIGNACTQHGMEVRFLTVAQLVPRLVKAKREEKLESLYKALSRAKLVILDELGYVPLDIEGARLLFQVITDCYEKRSLIITTNIEFGK